MHRGIINNNALKALVTSPVFKVKVVRNKKGKAIISVKINQVKGGKLTVSYVKRTLRLSFCF
ncbi:MAG: alternative ribosome rescue factor ArfA [Plesiomonas sp.]|uniref:alternative ribosome rescue factor ArfA n=1 Tax=Plesiomonas sp. TaxID=2486279 RepID=UPI003F2BFF54